MRKLACTQVRAAFREEMQRLMPAFRAEPKAGSSFELFVSDLTPVRFYVLLQLHHMRDAFTIEIGWSEKGRAPAGISFPMLPSDEPFNGEKCFRLRRLSRGENQDRWWELVAQPEGWPFSEQNLVDVEEKLTGVELKKRVDLVVAEAVTELAKHGGRYFRSVAAARQLPLPSGWPLRG